MLMIMDWCWRSKDLNPWWDFDNGDEEEDGVEEDDNNINEEEDYVSDNELALVVQGSEPLVRFSLLFGLGKVCRKKVAVLLDFVQITSTPPHNGRTVAPEAILFESPCRAHPET